MTTGRWREAHLADGVRSVLGAEPSATDTKFAGVEPTGLHASDFHDLASKTVHRKLHDATLRLLDRGAAEVAIIGCAGIAGLRGIDD